MGFIARIIKSLKIHPSGYFLIIYQCSYFKILIRFLLGEYK
ncbi:hypothetical protein LEP1GSC041_0566 [Leptospira noguchii str. 2006001870]|nr:hypothetical protein LEP1GSC041_0566 [Leptospira noguchii str. 2006001870]